MSNGNNNRGFTPRKKNALDTYGFNIRVPVNGEQGKFSNLSWEISRNSLGCKVYTGYSSDEMHQKGLIRARLDGIAFFGYLELIKQALTEKGEWKGKIEFSDFTFMGGKRSDGPQLISIIYVGRDEDGVIWTSIIDAINKDRPRIKFPFGAGRGHRIKHSDGTDYTNPEVSQLFAKAYYNMLSSVGATVMANEYVEPKPRQNNFNNNNNNNNNNNSGGNNNFDSDIPF